MPSPAISIIINENESQTLATLLPIAQLSLPAKVSAEPHSFNVSDNTTQSDSSNTQHVELVVFDSLTLKQLLDISDLCQVDLLGINGRNERLSRTTFRFDVVCKDIALARTHLTTYCIKNAIEAALVSNAPQLNQPGVLVMDMDSTTIEIECIDEIAKLAGVGEQVAEVTERAMSGELDFAQSLHQRVATLSGSPESILERVAEHIPLMDGLEILIQELKKNNWCIAIASGGFTYFADHLKSLLSLDAAFANQLEIIDGKLTGKVLGDVVDAQAKADVLLSLQQQYNMLPTQTVAMGDGANDLVMMSAAQLGVAFRAKPIVQAQADTNLNSSGLDGMVHWLR